MLVSMQLFTDIQMRVYRINDMLMDLSSELEFDLCRKKPSIVRATSFIRTLFQIGERYLFRGDIRLGICCAKENFASDLFLEKNPYKWFRIIFSSVPFYPSSLLCNFSPL